MTGDTRPRTAATLDAPGMPPGADDRLTTEGDAAPLDALLLRAGQRASGLLPDRSLIRLASGLGREPGKAFRRLEALARTLADVGAGTSDIAPSLRDRRFNDPAWSGNPLLRRWLQAYLATGATVEALIRDASLEARDEQRAQFVLGNLVDALSPSNLPLVNPTSVKVAVDTGGLSLARGAATLVQDLARRPRIPQMVDTSAFEVGGNLAVTPGAVVLRTPELELIQYTPQTPRVASVPLLVIPPTINKYYALDLAPGRSLAEYLVQHGVQVFMVSWRNPDASDADWGIEHYAGAILTALRAVERITGSDRTSLMGVCSGGIIASIVAAHLAADGTTGSTTTFSAALRQHSTSSSGTPTPRG